MYAKKTLTIFLLLWLLCALLAAQGGSAVNERRVTCEPQFPVAGQRVTFSAVNFRTPNLLRWDMGDGTVQASGSTSSQVPEARLTHAYAAAGIYEVKVYDDNGNVNSAPLTLLVWVKPKPEKTAAAPGKVIPARPGPETAAATPQERELPASEAAPALKKKNPWIKIGPYAGFYQAQDALLKSIYGNGDMIYGGRLGLHVWQGVYLWFSASQFISLGQTTFSEDKTTLTLTPLSVFLRLGISLGFFKPYAGAGFTYMSFKEESEIGNTKGSGKNYALEAGFELKMGRNFFLDFSARFDQIKVKPGEIEEAIDLGGLQAGVALLVSF